MSYVSLLKVVGSWSDLNGSYIQQLSEKLFEVTHYNDVIMDVVASQITSLTFVYSTDYSDADQRKMASNMENVSIWWRHHEAHSAYLSIFMQLSSL